MTVSSSRRPTRTRLKRRLGASAALVALVSVSACAVAPTKTPEEYELAEMMAAKRLTPGTQAARQAASQADPLSRAAFWSEEYERNPADLQAAREHASAQRAVGRAGVAAGVAQGALSLHPSDRGLLLILGAALIEDGRAGAAVEPLQRASDLDPLDPLALLRLGAALDHTGEHAAARMRYQRALNLQGQTPAALTNMGMSYVLEGDPEAGERYLRQAVNLPGSDHRARQNLALALALQGRFADAEAMAQNDQSVELARANVAFVRSMITRPARWDALRSVTSE